MNPPPTAARHLRSHCPPPSRVRWCLSLCLCLPWLALTAVAQPAARVPDGVVAHRDLGYVADGHERHKLDLYLPAEADGPRPLLIWVHGGGWQNGSKDGCPPLRNGYVGRGYAVASLNYRLSGHAVFPAQIEDCKAAIRWLRANAGRYRLDPDRFGVWGSSAGGHLVALLGTSGGVKAFEVGAHLDQSSRVQAVCDYYGPTDFTVFVTTPGYESHATASSPEAKLLGGAVLEHKDRAARANPITYVTPDDPAFLIVHGDQDPTVPINQSQLLFAALKQAGVAVRFHTIQGAGHGQGFGGPEIEPMVQAFFAERLQAKEPPSNRGAARTSESKASATPAPPGRSAATPNAPAGRPTFAQVLARDDADRDGRLSRGEFRGPPALFQRLDRNGDGFLSREEHETAFRPAAAEPCPAPAAVPEKAAPKPAAPEASKRGSGVKNFQLNGTDWTAEVDGQSLRGILVKPERKGPFPAVLISHGLGSNARQFGLTKARDLSALGLVCIATDYTHAQPAGDRRQFGASDENVRRARACLAVLQTLPEVDPRRIAAYGNSMGAFLTIRLGVDAADVLRAAAITAGGTAPAEGYPAPTDALAAKSRVPLLILHGTADTTVRPQQSEALQKVLVTAQVPQERHVFEGVGHDLHLAKAAEVTRLLQAWFQRHGVLP